MKDLYYIPQQDQEAVNKELASLTDSEIVDIMPGVYANLCPGFFYRRNYILPSKDIDMKLVGETIIENTKKGYPSLTTLTPELMAPDAEEILYSMGFKMMLCQYGMVFDMKTEFDHTVNPAIREIKTLEEIDEWTTAMLIGFKEENKQREDVVFHNFIKSDKVVFLAYYEGDQIAGTAQVFFSEGQAGVYEVAVPGEHRRKGIATALLVRILQMAEERGCKRVTLQASAMGRPVYIKLGFKECGQMHNLFLEE